MIIPIGKSFMYIPDTHNSSHCSGSVEGKEALALGLAALILSTFAWLIGYVYRKNVTKSYDSMDNLMEFLGRILTISILVMFLFAFLGTIIYNIL